SGPDMGDYTVVKVVPSGLSNSLIYVKEKIVSTSPSSPFLFYTKSLPIVAVNITGSNNEFFLKPGADEVAAQELADWVKAKFFSHEGMHVLEHILLRPKYNEMGPPLAISPANNNQLKNTAPLGKATFIKQFSPYTVDQVNKKFTIAADYTAELLPLKTIRITGSPFNDGIYTVRFSVFTGGNTEITVYDTIPDSTPGGYLQYSMTYTIQSVGGANMDEATIDDPQFVAPANGDVIITDSFEEENNGKFHMISYTNPSGTLYTMTFDTRIAVITDDFLPIELHNDCLFCRFDDPYSFIVSVILPAWQGRFFNQDFRRFFDRTLRLECPAHLILNICWLDCKQMGAFEDKYKKWLLENAKQNTDKLEVSKALNEVIAVLKDLRTVYPGGILHDCTSDTGPENAVILNQTALGNL
ncbi:MAG TPA: hypothetical protein VFU15_14400, partial [Bacteroidia bacterium]|nr:hypothetical protein [Bacteroidia bacterium]